MDIKQKMRSHNWLIGISNASFVFGGFFIGRGDSIIGLGLGLLGTAVVIADMKVMDKRLMDEKTEAYTQGLNHSARRTGSR